MISKRHELRDSIIADGLDVMGFTKLLVEVRDLEIRIARRATGTWGSAFHITGQMLGSSMRFQVLVPLFRLYAKHFDFLLLHEVERATLLCIDWESFHTHIEASDLNIVLRVEIVRANPKLFVELLTGDRITREQFSELLFMCPEISKVAKDIPYGRLYLTAWESLLAYDFNTFSVVLKNIIPAIRNKTYLRRIIKMWPPVVLQLTVQDIQKSVLTAKEWVLYTYSEHLKFSGPVVVWIDKEITMQVIAGSFTASEPLREAIDYAKAP